MNEYMVEITYVYRVMADSENQAQALAIQMSKDGINLPPSFVGVNVNVEEWTWE